MKRIIIIIIAFLISGIAIARENPFEKLDFLIGQWSGKGEGFGNDKSKIESSFQYVMDGTYIEVVNKDLSDGSTIAFESETIFDVSFTRAEFTCLVTNNLKKKE